MGLYEIVVSRYWNVFHLGEYKGIKKHDGSWHPFRARAFAVYTLEEKEPQCPKCHHGANNTCRNTV